MKESNSPIELELVEPVEKQLVEYASKTGLERSSTTPLIEAFSPIFKSARKAISDASGVAESVKDATCVTEIKTARACRLAIRKIRIEGEKTKKEQKANALTYGRAVDGFYNILIADLSPVEKALKDAEDTAERAETARKDALEESRKTLLSPYVENVDLYTVRDMSDEAFSALLIGTKAAKEQAEAAKKKAEDERIAKEKAEAAERERIRIENEKLRREAIEREAKAKAEREAAEKKLAEERAESARKEAEARAKAEAEAKAAEVKAAKERAEAEAIASKEKEAREKAEMEARQLREEKERSARKEAERIRRAAAAPDKEKIILLAKTVRGIDLPKMQTESGSLIGKEIEDKVKSFAAWIEKKAEAI